MKILFLSHAPHEVHLKLANTLGSRVKVIPFNWIVTLSKKVPYIGFFYIFISLLYSRFIKVKENILLVEGGSSLYVAVFLKWRYKNIKIVYLDADLFFYNLTKRSKLVNKIQSLFYNKIDAIISASEQNKEYALKYVDLPVERFTPYPKKVTKLNVEKKNQGLYIGRLDPDKNIKRIVRFALQCPFFDKFIFAGEGTYCKYIKKLAAENNKIIYSGYRKDVDTFYSECKFLIHIPDSDPHPCTTMEAALCDCFPIISKGVGTKYLFDDIFIIEDPDNFEEINKKICYIINNEKKAKELLNKSVKLFTDEGKSILDFENAVKSIIKSWQS